MRGPWEDPFLEVVSGEIFVKDEQPNEGGKFQLEILIPYSFPDDWACGAWLWKSRPILL